MARISDKYRIFFREKHNDQEYIRVEEKLLIG